MDERVILVDENDNQIGTEEKIKAHKKALLHRAFSILIFNSNKEVLLQRRALTKYHSPGLWTNTCCSHPKPGEQIENAVQRRLKEEMNMSCSLNKIFKFQYKAGFDNGLTEHEIDHVFVGNSDTDPDINPDEVDSFKWVSLEKLSQDIKTNPDNYTPWFKIIINKFLSFIDQSNPTGLGSLNPTLP
jgi:isopentenyl-diphosphate delta-isomerase